MSDILRELAQVKAVFQLRAIEAIITAQGTEAQRAETATEIGGSVHDGPVAESDAPKPSQPSSRIS